MPTIAIQYRWRYFDEARDRYFTTCYHCTEERIRKEHPDAVAVEGTRIERELVDDPLANSMAKFGQLG